MRVSGGLLATLVTVASTSSRLDPFYNSASVRAPEGNNWKDDLKTGEGGVMELDAPGPAAGLSHDRRSGYLFVAGAFSGTGRVYDEDFALVADLAFGDVGTSMINDVVVTKTAAFYTDSIHPHINKVTDNDSPLIVVNSESQQVYAVDPDTGDATVVDLGGDVLGPRGDGLVLRKDTLVSDNVLEKIYEVQVSLSADLSCGSVATRTLSNPLFDRQTTAMPKGNSMYAVNANLDVAEEVITTTAYEIVRVHRDGGELACEE
ncbi:unnamed protein product [Ectocarpus sp. CCAP 1310/34]|nr:unnamed protein product [Ectocarpus sp. CCAP 1310/34]